MGHWKTLHLFDDSKFYNEVVPSLKGQGAKWRDYYFSADGAYQLEDREVFSEERLQVIQSIANDLTNEFRTYSWFKKMTSLDKMIDEAEDFNMLLALIIFSECALFNPYFVMGRGVLAKQEYYGEQTILVDRLVKEIEYGTSTRGNIIGLGVDTIVTWVKHEELKKICQDYKAIVKNIKVSKMQGNVISHLFEFLSLAVKHNLGVISCQDMDSHALKNKKPIGKKINFKKVEIDRLVYEK